MKRRIITQKLATGFLVAALAVGMAPVMPAAAASETKEAAAESAGQVKITKVATTDPGEEYGLEYTWDQIEGATYEYRYKLADTADYFEAKATTETSAEISFSSYGEVSFQVRARVTAGGSKQYTEWTTKTLNASEVDTMLCEALNLEEGYVKNGIRYIGGLYASDQAHSDCDLDIALFTYGAIDKDLILVLSQNGRILDYGMLETKAAQLEDGSEYTQIVSSADGNAKTYGYYFDMADESGFVVTSDGTKVKAKLMHYSAAWDLVAQTESGSEESDEASKENESVARAALEKKAKALMKKDNHQPESSYLIYDINQDGTEELLYMRHYNRTEAFFFRYDTASGKVKKMKVAGKKSLGGVSAIQSSGKSIIVSMSDSAYSGTVNTYKMNAKGNLVAAKKYTYNYDKNVFKKNGKKITKKAFEAYQEKAAKKTNLMASKELVTSIDE